MRRQGVVVDQTVITVWSRDDASERDDASGARRHVRSEIVFQHPPASETSVRR